jgi:hypothetical protein
LEEKVLQEKEAYEKEIQALNSKKRKFKKNPEVVIKALDNEIFKEKDSGISTM